jgi:hypothetical protein
MSTTPSVRLVRLLPGMAGETQRVCHVVPVDDAEAPPPDVLVTYCGARLASCSIEFLSRVGGQPCFVCLMRAPLPDREIDAGNEGGTPPPPE